MCVHIVQNTYVKSFAFLMPIVAKKGRLNLHDRDFTFRYYGTQISRPFFIFNSMKKPLIDTSTLTNSQKIQARYFFISLPFILACLFIFDSWVGRGFWILVILISVGKAAEQSIKRKVQEKLLDKD